MSYWPDYTPTRRERCYHWRRLTRERLWRRLHPRQAAQQDAERAATFARIREHMKAQPFQLFNPSTDIDKAYRESGNLPYEMTPSDWTVSMSWEPPPASRLRRAWWAVLNAVLARDRGRVSVGHGE